MKSITWIAVVASWLFISVANCRPADTSGPTAISSDLDAATCDSNPSWTARSFLKEDCYVSVLDMFLQDYRLHPQTKFEFYSSFFPAPTGSNRVQTPKRYTTSKLGAPKLPKVVCSCGVADAESCTLALVMLYNFKSAELPGTYKAGHARTDMATFQEIYTTAHRMEENCIVGRGQASRLAWEPVGASHYNLSSPEENNRNLPADT
ncbi:MAG: hypothetical protein LQ350_005227 [Teloschistes chrysophthalmus]|nr:MAG: hypothetical protein LQ350_005227 [Niorma chrysophthalma]